MALTNTTDQAVNNDLVVLRAALLTKRPHMTRELNRGISDALRDCPSGQGSAVGLPVYLSQRGAVRLMRKLESDRHIASLNLRFGHDYEWVEVGLLHEGAEIGAFQTYLRPKRRAQLIDLDLDSLVVAINKLLDLSDEMTPDLQLLESELEQLSKTKVEAISRRAKPELSVWSPTIDFFIGPRGKLVLDDASPESRLAAYLTITQVKRHQFYGTLMSKDGGKEVELPGVYTEDNPLSENFFRDLKRAVHLLAQLK